MPIWSRNTVWVRVHPGLQSQINSNNFEYNQQSDCSAKIHVVEEPSPDHQQVPKIYSSGKGCEELLNNRIVNPNNYSFKVL